MSLKNLLMIKSSKRKETLIKSQYLCVNVKPEFLSLFETSQAVSLTKGKSNYLARQPMKASDKVKIKKFEVENINYEKKVMRLEKR